ncbi:hypothetical protein [Pontibacter akesuensis]|uniref:Uncharacterized protein n=1 Tax=Pontibacter akesuensis TaxID=388950 RepID=A0A1I7JY38_9BACT|nr:hypothetical protein [Pontibacter akesuensis]GHA76634.1 hypothetical protein GCM10007389_33280 [Pontibacter akesuensis]SFU90088.1 hypothetical protein SAMN04487941_3174 [Pontibacter akesuensis]
MELLVDKGFLLSFFRYNSSERHKPVYDDFVKFIRKLHPGFTLVSNFSSLDEIIEQAKVNPLLELIIEKQPKVLLEQDFEQKLKHPAYYHEGSCFKLGLVDFDNKDCSTLEEAFGYSYISGENMAYKWKPFFSDREDTSRCITSNRTTPDMLRFDSWEKLRDYKHPINSVLIVDGYILSDKSQQRIDNNLKPLLKSLLPNKKTDVPVDITIITEEQSKTSNFQALQQSLVNYLKEELTELEFSLSIVRFDRNLLYKLKTEGFSIHDRRIITNYFWIESGIGFNIINDKGKVKDSDSFINYKFNLLGHNYNLLQHILRGYAAYINIAKEVYGINNNRLLTQFNCK